MGLGEDVARLKQERSTSVAVCLPALNEQETVGPICTRIKETLMSSTGVVDELVVIDSASTDETVTRARAAGARVVQAADVLPHLPAERGKGEALWKALAVVESELIVYLDSDVRNFDEDFVLRLVRPLLLDDGVSFVKGFYERPMQDDAGLSGGRVTELVARPLLNLFWPELSEVIQPLAGEYAARRSLLTQLPFVTGYGVEIGLLIDVMQHSGIAAIAQADLGRRVHRNRPLEQLAPMAFEIMKVVFARAEESGRAKFSDPLPDEFVRFGSEAGRTDSHRSTIEVRERPPLVDVL